MEIEVFAGATQDIAPAAILYGRKEPGLGDEFSDDIFAEIE